MCGPLAQKPSVQVTSKGSTQCQGLTSSFTGKLEKAELLLYAAKFRVGGRIIQMFLKGFLKVFTQC